MTLTLCYLTLLLVVGSPGSGQPDTWDNPRMYGTCIGKQSTVSIHISPYTHELVMVRDFTMIRIELPKIPGYYELQYKWDADEVVTRPETHLLVRRGPTGFW